MSGGEQEHSQERLRRLKVRQWVRMCALGFIILLCGGAMGGAAAVWWMRPHKAFHHPGDMPHMLTERLSHELGLSNEQYDKVLAIFQDSHTRLEALRAQVQPEMDQEMKKVQEAINAVLTPEQQETWRRRFEEMQNRVRPHSGPDGLPDGPPPPGFGPGPGPGPGMFPGPPEMSHEQKTENP